MRTLFCLLVTAIPFVGTTSQAADPVLVGMLEQHARCGEEQVSAVRVLFAKDGRSWVSLVSPDLAAPYDLADIDWTIAFDGRNLGSVVTTDPGFESAHPWTFPRDYRLSVRSGQTLPSIANTRREFGAWCYQPEVRPLVVSSDSNFQDPDEWKPFAVGAGYRELLLDEFIQSFDEPLQCSNLPESYQFTASDLVIHKSYRDASGRQLIALRPMPGGERCDAGWDLVSPIVWFSITDTVRHVGSDLELIDAGDYDGDGNSEVVFWHSGYNRDGYIILYDGLRWRAEYIWSYH